MEEIRSDVQHSMPEDFFQQRELLRKAYMSNVEALKGQLAYLDQEAKVLEAQLNDCNKAIENNTAKTKVLTQQNAQKEQANQQLASSIRKIKIENARLSSFKSYIFNTFDIPADKHNVSQTARKEASPKTEIYNVPNVVVQPYRYSPPNSSKAEHLLSEIDEGIQKNIEAASPHSARKVGQVERSPQQSIVEQRKESVLRSALLVKPAEVPRKERAGTATSKSVQYVDGKKFFELAREKLSFEDFNKVIRAVSYTHLTLPTNREV
eukprot:TRINITY_DN8094_c0_g3_i1.p1 TRINITY_DN8094_c0_g3~~TRINITY_DN8094_c0_g3_i1.p1  ORF type:complete len:265 (+),score=72.82 TRINITY_DN8094_c0_g3_i1:68-862(+)